MAYEDLIFGIKFTEANNTSWLMAYRAIACLKHIKKILIGPLHCSKICNILKREYLYPTAPVQDVGVLLKGITRRILARVLRYL